MSRPAVLWLVPPLLVTGLVLVAALQQPVPQAEGPAMADRLTAVEQRLAELEAAQREEPVREVPAKRPSDQDVVGLQAPALGPHVKEWLIPRGPAKPATLVMFFEPWCPHSKRAIQVALPELHAEWGSTVEIVGLTQLGRFGNHEVGPDDALQLVRGAELSMAIGVESDNTLADFFRITGVPASAIVIDGEVVWRGHPKQAADALKTLYSDR